MLSTIAYEAAGASSARYSPRPLFRGSRTKKQTSRENMRRDRETVSHRHCERSEAIQLWRRAKKAGLLRRFAPRNDGSSLFEIRILGVGKGALRAVPTIPVQNKEVGTRSFHRARVRATRWLCSPCAFSLLRVIRPAPGRAGCCGRPGVPAPVRRPRESESAS
jgi:hypothetical protein